MKRSNLKFIFLAAGVAIGITAVSVYSCEKQEFIPQTASSISDDPTSFVTEPGAICGDMIQKKVITQDNRHVANALIYNDTKYYYVIMTPVKGYILIDSYMEMVGKMAEIPLDENGNVTYKEFEYALTGQAPSTMRKFRVPLKEIDAHSYGVVALELTNNTKRPGSKIVGWIDGKFIGEESPGRVFPYTKQVCLTTPGESNAATE